MGVDDPMKLMHITIVVVGLFIFLVEDVISFTNPNDFKILNDFRNNLENSDLLKWPNDKGNNNNDPCGPPAWPHVFCSNSRVTQIQVQGLGLKGPLPQNLNQLDKLSNVGLQRNKFNGKLPSFSGLSNLQYAYLDFNEFDSIPADFFHGLSSVRVLALDENPLNQSVGGWSIPSDLAECTQLVNFSCSGCNIVGRIPDFFGNLASLSLLRLASNKLSGEIPSTFRDSMLQVLWLNNQEGGGLTGSIDVIGTMVGLPQVWLHGNQFTGSIPDNIGSLTSLREFNVNKNRLVGLIPPGLANLNLQLLDLSNNMFMGSIPKFKASKVSYDSNSFCQSDPGVQCATEVSALLDFLHNVNYPEKLASSWSGNDPCVGPWWGISCNSRNKVTIINLHNLGLYGTLSPSLGNLPSLMEIHLEGNNLHGIVNANLTLLTSLRLLNLSGNDFEPPLPKFNDGVKVIIDGNPKLDPSSPPRPPSPNEPPSENTPPSSFTPSTGNGSSSNSPSDVNKDPKSKESTKSRVVIIVVASSAVFTILAAVLAVYFLRKSKKTKKPPGGVVIHPSDSSDPSNMVKIQIFDTESSANEKSDNALVFSLDVLRKATNDFAQEKELGRGGFGVVYKGELENGTKLAVKRMESGEISNKALDEFQTEISVLSSVRHRHLVSLLGYSVEKNERLLVYEYMPQGALSRHLFRWKGLGLEPLSWTRRLNIALDVARGVEYLHNLGRQCFVHRDLKSANILLDDDFRAKVSDFGLVKLALDTERSVATRLAGTFGYLAPEYAVTGKITTKVDVFSFGVILIELLTGLVALDERRPEEKRYLAEWFWQMKSKRETLIASIDPALDAKEEIYESIYAISELAGHCTARDPNYRPEIGHAVNVLGQMVEKWKPCEETDNNHLGVDFDLPLPQLLKGWQEEGNTRDFSGGSQDSKGSIPAKPSGFADSFTSADAR